MERKQSNTSALKRRSKGGLTMEELLTPTPIREQLTRDAGKLAAMVELDDIHREGVESTLAGGLKVLDEVLDALSDKDERLKFLIAHAARAFIGAGIVAAQATLTQEHRSADLRARGFDNHNRKRAAPKEKAQAMARKLWVDDAVLELRTADMGQMVHRELEKAGGHFVPTLRTVTDWVREVAPAHARKPGRKKADIPTRL